MATRDVHRRTPQQDMSNRYTETEDFLERKTNSQLEDLLTTVDTLKQVNTDISIQISKSDRYLDDVQQGIFDADGGLGMAMKKLKEITGAGGASLMCYVVLFVVFMFMLLYFAITWFARRS